jgi:hypothetical protein
MFKIMYYNDWTKEYVVETVQFVSRRYYRKVWRDASDCKEYMVQFKAVKGLFTRRAKFRGRPELRIIW